MHLQRLGCIERGLVRALPEGRLWVHHFPVPVSDNSLAIHTELVLVGREGHPVER